MASFASVVHNTWKCDNTEVHKCEGAEFCVFDSIRHWHHLIMCVCCIMYISPAVQLDPTLLLSTSIFYVSSPVSSMLKRAPTCLFSSSEAWSLLCPFFPLVLLHISSLISAQAVENGAQTSVRQSLLHCLRTVLCLKTCLISQLSWDGGCPVCCLLPDLC